MTQLVKNPPAMRETWVQSPSWEEPLEKGKATHSSILAWRIPWTIQSMGLQSWAQLLRIKITALKWSILLFENKWFSRSGEEPESLQFQKAPSWGSCHQSSTDSTMKSKTAGDSMARNHWWQVGFSIRKIYYEYYWALLPKIFSLKLIFLSPF